MEHRSDWKAEEDILMLEKIQEMGKKWSKIARILGNRSEHTVKNRYNKIVLRRLSREKQNNPNAIEVEIAEKIKEQLEEHIAARYKKMKNQTSEEKPSESGDMMEEKAIPTILTITPEKPKKSKEQKKEPFGEVTIQEKTPSQILLPSKMEPEEKAIPKCSKTFRPIIITLGNYRV